MIETEEAVKEEIPEEEVSFKDLYEMSLDRVKEGEIVVGTVLSVDKDFVTIDIGYKSEGHVRSKEFMDEDGTLSIVAGDEVEVYLEKKENEEGSVVISKSKADQLRVWDDIKDACEEEGKVVFGRIIQRIKGGFRVDIKGLTAFLPGSQVDIKPVLNQDALVGKKFEFRVLKYSRSKENIVLSRKILLEKERQKMRSDTLKVLEEGAVLQGVVKNTTDYGLFVDLGGIDGLVHITDISWGRVGKPSQYYSIGETIETKVLKYDKEKEKVSLGLKQLKEDPWLTVKERYTVGTRKKGKIVNITDYGAFVELEVGVEGLVHISEMSWVKKVKHPSQIVSLEEEVEVAVLDVDAKNRRLSLGIKQTTENPWDEIETKYPKGTKIKGTVTNTTDFGIFVGVEEGIDGLVHISDLSWKKQNKPISELYKRGDEVEAIVLNIDKNNERFSLGIKQLDKDPWLDIRDKYTPGMSLEGKVTNIVDFGVFVALEEGVEGLIHVSEFDRGKASKVKLPGVGETLEVEILNVDPDERKIGLGAKGLAEEVSKKSSEESTVEKMKDKAEEEKVEVKADDSVEAEGVTEKAEENTEEKDTAETIGQEEDVEEGADEEENKEGKE